MKEWTKEERYRVFKSEDIEELQQLRAQFENSPWRTEYHIQPVCGLLNDPNGFSFYNNKWHLFYQWFPYGPVHGMKHWYHVTSEDLVHWQNEGLAMSPDLLTDNYGCYSGSALPSGKILWLAYTGNSKDYDLVRHPYQLLAKMDENGKVTKMEKPLIYPQKEYTEHQRDPKLFRHNGKYYILEGAQNKEGKGVLLLFESESIDRGWKLLGEVKVRGYESFGFMCECPDIEKIGDKWLLLFSPQGLEAQGESFRNKYNNVYFTGTFDIETLEFVPDGEMKELDSGFDFYAAQCANQDVYKDAAVMTAWLSGPEYTCPPTEEEGWAHLLALPRLLTIEDGKLIQKPHPALEALRGEVLFEARKGEIVRNTLRGLMPKASVITLDNPDKASCELSLFADNGRRGFEISYDRNAKVLTIDRGSMVRKINEDYGNVRKVYLPDGLVSLEVYVDHSVVEIFVNNGEAAVSARIFPTATERVIRMGGSNIDLVIYKAEKACDDAFVI